ncbi:TPA: colicin release lysis protein [Escherichia coli]|jgi:hypothetical protein|nr:MULTISPECIES: colicin release lysis protein [Escherichia]EIP1873023.1 colicin release lysis protein [Salmonella enterica]EEG9495493.1 colicin release lysis protein [Escherichia coli]EEQ1545160.1 colicin release lysis protein [Escherichia coli]EEQ1723468.1 colicin release lysis protein [Escherichia coli]EEQ2265165.1 colicin release lysis protein [Escherichia coli]
MKKMFFVGVVIISFCLVACQMNNIKGNSGGSFSSSNSGVGIQVKKS